MGFAQNAAGYVRSGNQGVTDARSWVDAQAQAILSPFGTKGISGWVFDISTDDTLELTSEITDHYTESGEFVNDHIVNAPARVSLSGFVGEIPYVPPPKVFGAFQSLNNRLGDIPGYNPELVDGAIQKARQVISRAQRVASQINNELDRAQNLVAALSGDTQNATRQARIIQQLRSLWATKQVVTVQTPWAYYETMAIESIKLTHDDTTQSWTEVQISLKEIRFATVRRVSFDGSLAAPANEIQEAGSEAEQQGRAQATDTPLRGVTNPGAVDVVGPAPGFFGG